MDKISDEELVSRIQAGKEEWENVILVRYEDRILSWARMKHLSFVAGGDLDDLLQEGRLGLLKAMYAYDDAKGKSFSSFARICVQSQMISYVMAMTADKNKILNEAVSLSSSDEEGEEPLLERLPGPSKDPESKVIAKESYAELWEEAKETLSSFELQIFPFYLRGYTSGQIADLLHMNAKSVDNGIQRIRRKIIIEA